MHKRQIQEILSHQNDTKHDKTFAYIQKRTATDVTASLFF